jgi:hypothetical protein
VIESNDQNPGNNHKQANRLSKLEQMFGEIPSIEVGSNATEGNIQSTTLDKRNIQKRMGKLGQMFGEDLPISSISFAPAPHTVDNEETDDDCLSTDQDSVEEGTHSEAKETKRRNRNKVSEVLGEKPPSQLLVGDAANPPSSLRPRSEVGEGSSKTANRLSKIFNDVFFGGSSVSDSLSLTDVLNVSEKGLPRTSSSIRPEAPMVIEDVKAFKQSTISKKIDAMIESDHSLKSTRSSKKSSARSPKRPSRRNSVTESELALPIDADDSSSDEYEEEDAVIEEDEDNEDDTAKRNQNRKLSTKASLDELVFDEKDSSKLFIWRK